MRWTQGHIPIQCTLVQLFRNRIPQPQERRNLSKMLKLLDPQEKHSRVRSHNCDYIVRSIYIGLQRLKQQVSSPNDSSGKSDSPDGDPTTESSTVVFTTARHLVPVQSSWSKPTPCIAAKLTFTAKSHFKTHARRAARQLRVKSGRQVRRHHQDDTPTIFVRIC